MAKGRRLLDIVLDEQEDLFYEDSRAMKLSKYVMAERCLQVQLAGIFFEKEDNDFATLTYILEGGFKGFHNMDSSELIKEYKDIEDKWYELEADNELNWEPYEEDPINKLKEDQWLQKKDLV